jgi:hypothetical protein
MSDEDLLEALRLATQAEFGEAGVEEAPERDPKVPLGIVRPQSPGQHVAFLASLALGGTLAALVAGSFEPSAPLSAPGFLRRFGEGLPAYLVLILGGVLVGFGTRMSGGCTSGHGLCGVSRFQPGSAVATACFFGMGILASFAIGALT